MQDTLCIKVRSIKRVHADGRTTDNDSTNFEARLFACNITSRCELLRGTERSKLRRKSWSSRFDGARKCFRERFAVREMDGMTTKSQRRRFLRETIDERAEEGRISRRTDSSSCENRIKALGQVACAL